MKQSAINDLEARTLQTSIETINERVNTLGVSEPVVQQYGLGENQILVELPGIENPGAGGGGDPVDVEAGGLCGGERTV